MLVCGWEYCSLVCVMLYVVMLLLLLFIVVVVDVMLLLMCFVCYFNVGWSFYFDDIIEFFVKVLG